MPRTRWTIVLLLATLAPFGCSRPMLMPTPVAFDSGVDPVAETPEGLRTPESRVFIVTDRTHAAYSDKPSTFYANDRNYGLCVGEATVELARKLSWDELHAASVT